MMRTLAKLISFLFHPLLMVTYGVTMALQQTFLVVYPLRVKWLIWGGAFLSTALLPGLFIYLLVRQGAVSDWAMTNRRERLLPFLIFGSSVGLCLYFFARLQMPLWLLFLLIGACLALIITLCINFYWKISAHAVGVGGLLGGLMGVSQFLLINPYWAFIGWFLIAGLVGTSRIFLKRHTPMQVYTGFCLGFMCTFVASMMSYIFLFI